VLQKSAIADLVLEINYFLPKISNFSSPLRHVKHGRCVHYGNVIVWLQPLPGRNDASV